MKFRSTKDCASARHVNQLLDAFIDTKRVTKSYIPAANTPVQIEIPKGQSKDKVINESITYLKHGRHYKDKNSQKNKRNRYTK